MSNFGESNTFITSPDEITEITSRKKDTKKRPKIPPFFMGGTAGKMNNLDGYQLLDVMTDMSVGEHWLFKLLRDAWKKETNIAYLPNARLNKQDQRKKNIAYKKLYNKKLIKRVKHDHYMINPSAIVYSPTFEDNLKIWNSLP